MLNHRKKRRKFKKKKKWPSGQLQFVDWGDLLMANYSPTNEQFVVGGQRKTIIEKRKTKTQIFFIFRLTRFA